MNKPLQKAKEELHDAQKWLAKVEDANSSMTRVRDAEADVEAYERDYQEILLNQFILVVGQARDARIQGQIEKALNFERTIELYYAEAADMGFSEDVLVEAESEIRD